MRPVTVEYFRPYTWTGDSEVHEETELYDALAGYDYALSDSAM